MNVINGKRNNGGKKKEKREHLNCFCELLSLCNIFFYLVPPHYATKSVSFKSHLFFAFSPTKKWKFETKCFGKVNILFFFPSKVAKVLIFNPTFQKSNSNKSKTAQTGFEEISETSINKAFFSPILLTI